MARRRRATDPVDGARDLRRRGHVATQPRKARPTAPSVQAAVRTTASGHRRRAGPGGTPRVRARPTASTTGPGGRRPGPLDPGRLCGWSAVGPERPAERDPLAVAARAATGWRALAAVVDSVRRRSWGRPWCWATRFCLRRDWWLVVLVAVAGVVFAAPPGGRRDCRSPSPSSLRCSAWRSRSSPAVAPAPGARVLSGWPTSTSAWCSRRPLDSTWSSIARRVTRSCTNPRPAPSSRPGRSRAASRSSGIQPGFRYWRFLERLVLGEGDPFVVIVGLTLLAWGCLWAIAQPLAAPGADLAAGRPVRPGRWPRPRPGDLDAGPGLHRGAAERVPHVGAAAAGLHAPLRDPKTPAVGLGWGSRRRWRVLCRLNHLLAILGYLAVFAQQRWRGSPASRGDDGRARARDADPAALHNRYYGGPRPEALRIMNVNRAAVAISPSRLAELHRDPSVAAGAVGSDPANPLHSTRPGGGPGRDGFIAARDAGAPVAVAGDGDRRVAAPPHAPGHEALLLVPLLYFVVYLLYDVEIYYPRHILAGHLALGVSCPLRRSGAGWAGHSRARLAGRRPRGPARRVPLGLSLQSGSSCTGRVPSLAVGRHVCVWSWARERCLQLNSTR